MSSFTTRSLGKTGLQVSPLGIGGGWGIDSKDLFYAFERGINYFFFSSDMHHFAYSRGAAALRKLCGLGSATRQQVVLATVSYLNDPEKLPAILLDQFGELGVDYIDIFHWGWITDQSEQAALIQGTKTLQAEGELARNYRTKQAAMLRAYAQEVNADLIKRGLVRYVGASFHSQRAARNWMSELDVLMVRYNVEHLSAERELFPHLSGDKSSDPGIVAFNVARMNPAQAQPENDGSSQPTIPDHYRAALSNPHIDLVLTGVRNRAEIDQALEGVAKGPLTPAEQASLRGMWSTAQEDSDTPPQEKQKEERTPLLIQ